MMGGSCSLQRQRASQWHQHRRRHQARDSGTSSRNGNGTPVTARALRHSVDTEVPDRSIASLYPVEDNYVPEGDSRRSPKSLVELCTDEICRSLPDLDGVLPYGLPQDVVDDIVRSLMQHSALNATTLRALQNCELGTLSLAGCRGVTDEWLAPLTTRSLPSSPVVSPLSQPDGNFDAMELDDPYEALATGTKHQEVVDESSSCSTSSFVSASSTPYVPSHEERMSETNMESFSNAALTQTSPPTYPMGDFSMNYMEHIPIPVTLTPSLTSNLAVLDLRGSQRLTDKGLLQLRNDLHSLEVAKLDNCHALVGRGLLAFSSSYRLHTLSLANCRRLTDEAVINISHLTSLEALSLDGCRCLTDRSLAAMSGLCDLRKLDLSQCDLLTDDGLDYLGDLDLLDELSLGWCRSVTDRGVEILTKQAGRNITLKVLRLARCPITDAGIDHVGSLTALEELDLNGCSNVGSSALGNTLGKLPNLRTLDVSYCPGILRSSWQGKINSLKSLELCYSGVRDSHLAKVTHLPSLEELNLDSCPVGDWAISHLADNNVVPNLNALDLADTDLTDLGMQHLPKFTQLTKLSLFYCNVTNAGLRHIENMTNLEVLNLDSREIGDDGLAYLRNLSNLQSLDIFSGRVTDLGCAHISRIKSLKCLEICGGGIGDLGCTLLATLENLESLNLSQNERITNRGAAALAALSNLKALNLSNTRVNSAALRFFSGLVKLQSLALYGCRGIESGPGLENLQSELPSLKCLRLNVSSDDDGVVSPGTGDSDDSSDSSVDGDLAEFVGEAGNLSHNESHHVENAMDEQDDEEHHFESDDDASMLSEGDR